ncbi:immunoglobulin domain-containing protein [Vibrio sp. Vb2131]|uniref:immunoglobulin domain-containing protein n=1 Tax=Vibrio sp. Vb2131 TaxID=3074649 RepID=UPI00398C9A52
MPPQHLWDTWDLNTGPHAWTASTLSTDPSPQPLSAHFVSLRSPFQNGKPVRYYYQSSNFSIPKANHSHSGNYYCKAYLGRTMHVSKPVTITVQGSATASTSSLVWFHAAFCLVMCLLFAVDTGLYFCVRRNLQTSGEDWRKSLSVGKYKAPQDK